MVRVTVTRNKNQPIFVKDTYTVNIKETQQLRVAVAYVNATDKDMGGDSGRIQYILVAKDSIPTDVDKYFYVNPTTGAISVTANLETEPQKRTEYQLSVLARDFGNPPLQDRTTVRINVRRNLNPPTFAKRYYNITIDETEPLNGEVYRIQAQDKDSDEILYSITGTIPASEYFAIGEKSGRVTVKHDLARGPGTEYTLTILAKDKAEPPKTDQTTLVIKVERNPNAPLFDKESYNITIGEYRSASPPNNMVVQVQARDKDSDRIPSGKLVYSFKATTQDADKFFAINPSNGRITIAQSLSSQQSPKTKAFEMVVTAKDQGMPPKQRTVQVKINVLRNEFQPAFSMKSYVQKVDERPGYNSTVLKVTATDGDSAKQPNTPNSKVMYKIDQSDNNGVTARKFFDVNSQDGRVFIRQPLTNDLDQSPQYKFNMIAQDMGVPSKSVKVPVTINVIRHTVISPSILGFKQPLYVARVQENVGADVAVLTLAIQVPKNVTERYCFIISGNDDDTFKIANPRNRIDCVLSTQKDLDREKKSQYNITVGVRKDIGPTRRKRQTSGSYASNKAQVIIMVMDVDDNKPEFIFPKYPSVAKEKSYYGAISASAEPFQFIMAITATDPDLGHSGLVMYGMKDPEKARPKNPPFLVLSKDGSIYNTRSFTNGQEQFFFDVYAQNSNSSLASKPESVASVYINLIRDKDRLVLNIDKQQPSEVYSKQVALRDALQAMTGQIIIIEKVVPGGYYSLAGSKEQKPATEVWFTCISPTTNKPCETKTVNENFLEAKTQTTIKKTLKETNVAEVSAINSADGQTPGSARSRSMAAAEGELLDTAWWALIALAGVIILFCLVGIIIICFSWARYKRYVDRYRHMYVAPVEPVFVEPPSFLKEYETQSLAMYVPPDEPVQETGEINMTFQSDEGMMMGHHGQMGHMHGQPGTSVSYEDNGVAAINPIYQSAEMRHVQQGAVTSLATPVPPPQAHSQYSTSSHSPVSQELNGNGSTLKSDARLDDEHVYPENTTIL